MKFPTFLEMLMQFFDHREIMDNMKSLLKLSAVEDSEAQKDCFGFSKFHSFTVFSRRPLSNFNNRKFFVICDIVGVVQF